MTTNVSAAFRHLGIALIDLEYAILELSQCRVRPDATCPRCDALADLIGERDRLRDLSEKLAVAYARVDPPRTGWTRTWWPDYAAAEKPDWKPTPS